MGFLRTIFFILLFYYVFKFLAKMFAPFLMKKMVDNMQKKTGQQFGEQQERNTVKEGETVIDKTPRPNNQSKNSVGEYVDFEEIE